MLGDIEKKFIREHLLDDVNELLLQASKYKELDVRKLVAQIEARQKARFKLPDWYLNEDLVFPPPLSVEQCSSMAAARYKASLVRGRSLVDGSGGMGVDCFYMSQRFDETTYIEQQQSVAETASENFKILGASNVQVVCGDVMEWGKSQHRKFDWLYLDPARRDTEKRKVVRLEDCSPDIASNLAYFLDLSPRILLKTSPLLDIDQTVHLLQFVKEVHIIGVGDECKEVLYYLDRGESKGKEPLLKVVVLEQDGAVSHQFTFCRSEEAAARVEYSTPELILYEPHPAVLKAGAFRSSAEKFGLKKLGINSHLYTSNKLIPNFPGRCFQIVGICKPNEKEIRKWVPDGKANLTLRNFPAKINDLRKKWRLKEGGDTYLFATTLFNGTTALIVTRK